MKLVVFGRHGQVAQELRRRVPDDVSLKILGSAEVDFAAPEQVHRALNALSVDGVINAAAYTKVDAAETETDRACAINGHAVGALGQACAAKGIPLVHISTDYVFPGTGDTAWQPDDTCDPPNAYGKSKLLGEKLLNDSAARFAILRTSWVFSAHGSNFVRAMLAHGRDKASMPVVANEVGGPTPAAAIADACLTIARALADGHKGGKYHFSGSPEASWADFAEEIFRLAGYSTKVDRITSRGWAEKQKAEGKTHAQRPLNSRLDCSSLKTDFGISQPDWKIGLKHVREELQTQSA